MGGLSWLNSGDPPSAEFWPDTSIFLFAEVRDLIAPLTRALLLAGYRPYQVDVVRAGMSPQTYRYDDMTAGYTTATTPSAPSTGSGIYLAFSDLFHERAAMASNVDDRSAHSHALTVDDSEDAPWPGLVPGENKQIEIWSRSDWGTPQWRSDVIAAVGEICNDIIAALQTRIEDEDNAITPRARAGLLWLLNPLFWFGTDVTFPAEFGTNLDEPLGPQPWPQAAQPQAASHDPLAVTRPDDQGLSEMIAVAGKAWESLLKRPNSVLRGMVYDDRWNKGSLQDVLGWLSRLLGNNRMRQFWYSARQYGIDDTTAAKVESHSWIDLLLLLADTGVLAPAGYPLDAVVVAPVVDELDFAPADPVLSVWYREQGAQERVVLEVAGIPAVTVTATSLCTVPLINAFTWDYLAPSDVFLLTLIVVAGPGIELQIEESDRDLAWSLEVIRVWDYSPVLERGARVQPEALLAPFPLSWEPDEPERWLGTEGIPLYGLTVYPQPHGMVFEYPTPRAEGEVPSWRLTTSAPELSGNSRIAYDVQYCNPEGGGDGGMIDIDAPSMAVINVWVSKNVEVSMERLEGSAMGLPHSSLHIWQFDDASQIPLNGTTLPLPLDAAYVPPITGPQLREAEAELPETGATRLEFPLELLSPGQWMMLQFALDIGVGMIPYVGDAVDIVELVVSIGTMKDRWGRPVNLYDQMLMLFSCMIPFVSSTALRRAGYASAVGIGFALEMNRGENTPLMRYLFRPPNLPAAQQELLNLAQTSRTFLRFNDPARQARVVAELAQLANYRPLAERLGRTAGEDLAQMQPLAIVDLLTVSRTDRRFWLPGLQAVYGRWRKGNPQYTDDEAILVWISRTSGVQRAVLEAMIGNPASAMLRNADLPKRSPRLSAHWPSSAVMERVAVSGNDALSYDTQGAMLSIRDAAYNIANFIVEKNREVDLSAADRARLSRLVNLLLCNISPTKSLDTALAPGTFAGYFLGQSRNLSPDDLAELLMRGFKSLDEMFENVTAGSGQLIRGEEYMQIPGHQAFFKDLITHSGYEHTSVMEAMVGCEEYARLARQGITNPGEWIQLQAMIGSAKGPDMIRKLGNRLQVVETKSFMLIWHLLDANTHAANQVFRYVDALHTGQLVPRLPNGTVLPPHPEILMRADPTQFIQFCRKRQSPAETYTDLGVRAANMENVVNEQLRIYCRAQGIKPVYRIRIEFNPLYR